MRVLHIFYEINFSGAEIMYANAAKQFQNNGFELFALSTGSHIGNFTAEFEKVDIKIFHTPYPVRNRNPFILLAYIKNNIKFIKEHKIDIVHIHRSDQYWIFSLCTRLTGKRAIMTPHNVFKNRKITWIKAYLERLSARKLFNLTFQTIGESVYQNELNYYKNPSVKINNWYNSNKFYPAVNPAEKELLRKQLGLSLDAYVIISTGSCSHIKNHSDIIKALPIIAKNFECLYLHLGNGELEGKEKDLARELNMDKNVYFLGNKINVRDYLVAADVYVMTSKFEGLSIAAIEAMACYLPSILYNSPGLRDLIKDDDNGFLIKPNYEHVAQKVIYLKKNPEVAKKMAQNAFNYVNENYSMNKNVSQIIDLYRS